MGILQISLGIALMFFSLAIIVVVLLQEGHQQKSGMETANSETFYMKHKSRSIDAFLERWTKFIAVGFFFLVIAVNVVIFFA